MFAIRKSDNKKLLVKCMQGDEICVIEKFPFWSKKGTITKNVKLWHKKEDYIIQKEK